MKSRLESALTQCIAANPRNAWLRRQQSLLQSARISTIHTFCFDLIRDHCAGLDITPTFRIMEETEMNMLVSQALTDTMTAWYGDPAHAQEMELLCDRFCGQTDAELDKLMTELYRCVMGMPFGLQRMKQLAELYGNDSFTDMYLEGICRSISACIQQLEEAIRLSAQVNQEKLTAFLITEQEQLTLLQKACQDREPDRCAELFGVLTFATFPRMTKTCTDPGKRELAKALRDSSKETMQQLKKDNLALQQERDWILQAEGLEPDDLTVQPLCPNCGGTGYVGANMCECLRELCRQEQKKELAALFGTDSFEKFRLELYSDQYDAKCHSSPRELMRATYRRAQSYAQSFPAEGQSLLFSGATGLGKTYLSACIARVVADRGFSVSYAPVGQLFAAFEDDKFRPQPDVSRTEPFFTSDLLILDDLGTEMTTQFTISVLYQLLNTRLMEKKPVILSTNLAPNELAARYTPQIASRLLGTYCLFQFYGDDIRFKLK